MANLTQAYYKMFILDELALQKTAVHRINPVIKLVVTFIYLIVVVSYDKYEIAGLIPLIFYPAIIAAVGNIPIKPLIAGFVITAPLIMGIGIFNPILDTAIVMRIAGIEISAGFISFTALLLKGCLTVSGALLLLATTGVNNIATALNKLHLPQIFIVQLLLTYRYIAVLLGEAGRINNAYILRAPQQRGISIRVWGSLLGQLLLRTYDRASRVYQAMKLRGFDNQYTGASMPSISRQDIIFLVGWTVFFVLARLLNIPIILGLLMTGVIK